MRDLERQFCKGRGFLMDFCAGTCFKLNDCIVLDQQKPFTACDVSPEGLIAAEPDLVLTLASQILGPKSDTCCGGEVEAAG